MAPASGLQSSPTDSAAADPSGAAPERVHVAIIMDGNGRWAKQRGVPRALGHREGVQALKRTIEAAPALGVERLTVFGFSTENWSRPPREVSDLMGLMKAYVSSDLERLHREGVRVRILGRRRGLPGEVLEIVERAEARTAGNDRFHLQVAFNYGGQADILDAARAFAEEVKAGRADPADLDAASFQARLSTAGIPAPDLIVRTSGEKRLSNFLLWEAAYAEFVFQDVLWPDYGPEHLKAAVAEYRTRERRYGGSQVDDAVAAG